MGSKRKRSAHEAPVTAPAAKKQQQSSDNSPKTPTVPIPPDTSPFLDNPKGADLKREVLLYNQLASEVDSERLDAANTIVLGLLGGESVEESTLQRHLERRLFRGLASGRKGARLGFGVVITELLAQLFGENDLARTKYADLSFEKIFGFLVAKTKPDGDLSGQEEKDHSLGLLFGLESFVKAKILFRDETMWNAVLEKLLELAKKKPWTREQCGWVIVEALPQMNQSQAEATLESLYNAGLAISPEGVGVWLMAKNRFPEMKVPAKPWGQSGNPLERLQSLAKALKESSSGDEGSTKIQQAKQTGNWNPQLHFVWDIVLAQFAKAVKAKTTGIEFDFGNFWKVSVDENLFSATASRERKFWGFLLFQKVLQDPDTYAKLFPSVFSHNLVRCLINHIQDKDRFLHRAADKSLKILIETVEEHPNTLPVILPCLIGGYGTYNFDKITKTKTIDRLLAVVNDRNAREVIDVLVAPALLVEGSDATAEAEMRRVILGDYILSIVRHVNMPEDSDIAGWIGKVILPVVAKVAYGNDLLCTPPLSEKTRTLFRNRLMSIFGHVLSDLNGFTYPCELLQSFTPDAVGMDDDIEAAKDQAVSTMKKILKKSDKSNSNEKPPLQALALLYSLVIFQLYNGEPEAISILDELKLCYDKLIRHKESNDTEVDASEVLVELLLSFLSKPSALLRKVTQHVFSAFMGDITSGGLKLMTDVLESSESLRGQQDLFDNEQEDEAQSEEDEENDEMDSDVEVIDMNGDEGHLNGHLNEDSDEDEEETEESQDENDEEAQKLDDALAKALGTHRLDQDLKEEESDSDADMTDSEMMALDSKLVEIFSQRKKAPNKKQEQKDAKETMVNFKSRVLDLLDIYVKKQAGNNLALGLLLPLLQLIRTTKTKQLAERAYNIILAFSKASKSAKKDPSELNLSEQIKLLKAIHLEASQDPSNMFAKAASSASLLIASSLYRADRGSIKKIAKAYMETQVAWVSGEVKMQTVFFDQWNNWCQSHAKSKLGGKEE